MGGVRLKAKEGDGPPHWIVQRWMRVVEENASPDQLTEGMEYARMGQARSLVIAPGLITARVQGRMPKAYEVRIRVPTLANSQWEQLLELMRTQARFVASMLAGELPASVEDLFGPLGLKLFPTLSSDIAPSCTCDIFRGKVTRPMPGASMVGSEGGLEDSPPAEAEGGGGVSSGPAGGTLWCKHVNCVMALVGERLAEQPFLIFELRGMGQEDLLERIRQLRIASGATRGGLAPVVRPHVADVPEGIGQELEAAPERFWQMGPEVDELDLPVDRPELAHPLLRRLGASPFPKARFPLVGLLATCYEVISEAAIRDASPPPEPVRGAEDEGQPQAEPEPDQAPEAEGVEG